ncbi:hypothetical protein [Pseudomonas sp. EA_65y_Pfl1_P113]|uniref:hypothetical protein n=1 Tax=Pseudomonas sp. EA_65y_Pfl1_P113 TaxID=3088692 RepID=UPI0030DC17A5
MRYLMTKLKELRLDGVVQAWMSAKVSLNVLEFNMKLVTKIIGAHGLTKALWA